VPRTPRLKPCRLLDGATSRRAPRYADLTAARDYHSYVAVTAVAPLGHHFDVWYHGIEPNWLHLLVKRETSGRLSVMVTGGGWGGVGVAPREIPPLPRKIVALAREVQADLCRRCRQACKLKMSYGGEYRRVVVSAFVPVNAERTLTSTERIGWRSQAQLAMDASLSRILIPSVGFGGFGLVRLPADVQWIPAPQDVRPKDLLSRRRIDQLSVEIVAAARRFDSKAPARSLASLAPDASLMPRGWDSRVVSTAYLPDGTGSLDSRSRRLRVAFDLRDAVFTRNARAEAERKLGQRRFRLRATLIPQAPRSPTPRRTQADFRGRLTLHLEDDRGHSWRRVYPVTGRLDLEGDLVAAPSGLLIPSSKRPRSSRCATCRCKSQNTKPRGAVDLQVSYQLEQDFVRRRPTPPRAK